MKTGTFTVVALTFTFLGFVAAAHVAQDLAQAKDTPRSKRIAPGLAQSQLLPAVFG